MKEFIGTGIIPDNGQFRVFELNDLKKFLEYYKGHRFTFSIKIDEKEKSKEFLGYYWKVVIPKMKRGFFNIGYYYGSKTRVDEECRKATETYVEEVKEDGTGYKKRLKGISEMETTELFEYIEQLKILAAEYMGVYIDDPITF